MSETKLNGLEPQLGDAAFKSLITGREPALGGSYRFSQQIWNLLIEPGATHDIILDLSSASCRFYADLLLKILPAPSSFTEVLADGSVWSQRYTPEQRAAAVNSLMRLSSRLEDEYRQALVAPLLEHLTVDEHERVVVAIVEALGLIGNQRVARPMMGMMPSAGWRVRISIINALGMVGDRDAVDYLWRLWQRGQSMNEVMAAMESLGVLGSRLGEEQSRPIYDALRRVLVRGDGLERGAAARALGLLRDSRALDDLLHTAVHGRGELQCAAVQGLGLLKDPQAVPFLIVVLTDYDSPARRDAVQALTRIGQPSVEPTIAVLRHSDPAVRQAAADVLGRVGAVEAVKHLCDLLLDPSSDVRATTVRALGTIGDLAAVEPLIGMLSDPFADVRKEAAAMLARLRDERAVGSLCLALWDVDMTVRWFAAYALGVIGDTRAADSLCKVLADRSEHVSSTAADALLGMGEEVIPTLIEHLKHDHKQVKRIIISILERFDSSAAQSALTQYGRPPK